MSARGRRAHAGAGTVALEFALIAPAFLGLVMLVLELGFLLFATTALDYAAKEAARQLQTGLARTSAATQTGFSTVVFCPVLALFLDCSRVTVSLQPVANYKAQAAAAPPVVNGQINPASLTYDPGQSGDLMLLQVYYTPAMPVWPVNVAPLVGSAAFRNEFPAS